LQYHFNIAIYYFLYYFNYYFLEEVRTGRTGVDKEGETETGGGLYEGFIIFTA
jgi:hypothetical protein